MLVLTEENQKQNKKNFSGEKTKKQIKKKKKIQNKIKRTKN
jgi:DNA-directed RNA polymerase subunit E'/Rpb7